MRNRDHVSQGRSDAMSLPNAEPRDTHRHDFVRGKGAHRRGLEHADFVAAHNATIRAEG